MKDESRVWGMISCKGGFASVGGEDWAEQVLSTEWEAGKLMGLVFDVISI